MTDQIVVGVDGSEGAADALRWAVREGRHRNWGVTAVLAWTFLAQHRADRSEEFDPDYSEADAATALEAYVREALGDAGAAGVSMEVVCERAAQGLLLEAADAQLLVVASRGLGGFRGLLVGSTSQQCLHHSTIPVAVVRPGVVPDESASGDAGAERVVVGVDGSDTSIRALGWALDQARASGAKVDVVHSWIAPFAYGFPAAVPLDPVAYATAAEQVADGVVAACDTTGVEVATHTVTGGSIAGALLEQAEGADLVVIGSRGVGGFRGMLLGSVAHHVAQHAPCPVVVVPYSAPSGEERPTNG